MKSDMLTIYRKSIDLKSRQSKQSYFEANTTSMNIKNHMASQSERHGQATGNYTLNEGLKFIPPYLLKDQVIAKSSGISIKYHMRLTSLPAMHGHAMKN